MSGNTDKYTLLKVSQFLKRVMIEVLQVTIMHITDVRELDFCSTSV